MDFEFAEEYKMYRKAVRDFAIGEIEPLVAKCEAEERFPVELYPKMGDLGYVGIGYPAEYGGAGIGKIGECIAMEEMARISLGIGGSIAVHNGIATFPIFAHGTEEQKRRFLEPAIRGRKVAAYAMTEPDAGSDVLALKTTAKNIAEGYVLNGTKMWITNGTVSDFMIVVAYTDRTKGSRGLSLFIVEKDTPGLGRRKLHKFCMRSSDTAELVFENCPVPRENLIGEEGKGFGYILENLAGARVVHAAGSLGLARAAYEVALKYARERVQFGQPIAKFQSIGFKLARMAMNIEAANWLIYHAAWLCDQGGQPMKEAVIAKLFASEMAQEVARDAMQIHGSYGVLDDSLVQRCFRDATLRTVTEGTSEINELVLSREIGIR